MKIFISWSGQMSHEIASRLRDWLPYVIQCLKPFVSSGDINKGARWGDVLANELKGTEFGIICITPYNINASWLNFEAGALSKSIDHSSVFPFLSYVNPADLTGPLSQFQSTIYEKEDIFNLLFSINAKLNSEQRLKHEILRNTFDRWWPQLESELNTVQDTGETKTGYQWLYSENDLRKIETTVACNSVWVITPFPYEDLQDTCIREAVQRNIKRGIRYSFLLPDSDMLNDTKELLQHLFSSNPEQLTIQPIQFERFRDLTATYYVILNPDGEEPRVFLKLPIKQKDYWIEAEKESGAAFNFIARFSKVIKGDNAG